MTAYGEWWLNEKKCPKCGSKNSEPTGTVRQVGMKLSELRVCKDCKHEFEARGSLLKGN